MSILSTNHRLISIGESYSAGSGIDITDQVISVTGDVVPYSAGDNIDIQGHVISGKDWTQEITDASSDAFNETTAWVHDNYANSADVSYLSGVVDNKLDTSAWSSVSSNFATEDYVIMADNITYDRTTGYVENQQFAKESACQFAFEQLNTNKLDASSFTDWQNGQYSTDLQTIEGQIANKLDTSSFSEVSGDFQPRGDYVERDTVYSAIESATSSKLDVSSFASVSSDFLTTAFGISESATWNDVSETVQTNSAYWADGGTGDEEVNSFVYNNSATINEVNTAYQQYSASYQPLGNYIPYTGYDAVKGYSTNSSFTIQDGTFTNSLGRGTILIQNRITSNIYTKLAAGPTNISFITPSDSAQVDLSSINKWNDVSTTVQSNSAQWAEGGGSNPEVESYVINNSATIDEVNTTYQSNSANYLTAHQSLTNYYTTAEANTLSSMLSGAIDYVSANAGGGNVPVSNSGDLYKVEFDGVDLYGYKSTSSTPNYAYSAVSSKGRQGIECSTYPTFNGAAIDNLENWSAFDIISISSNGVQIYPPEAGDYGYVTALDVYFNARYLYDYNNNQLDDFSGYIGKITQDNLVISSYFDKPSYFNNIARCGDFKLWFSANQNQGQLNNNYYICSVGNKVQTGTSTIEGILVKPIESPSSTIIVTDGNKIDCTNSAVCKNVIPSFTVTATRSSDTIGPQGEGTLHATWSDTSEGTTLALNASMEGMLSYSSNLSQTGRLFVGPSNYRTYWISLPNATAVDLWNPYVGTVSSIIVSSEATSSYEVKELAPLTALPTYQYDEQDRISAINGSAIAAGGSEIPTGTMNVSGLEYNAVGEISGYGSSAIAQYGAEKQWLQHDDTIVHVANSAQYAFGVNVSALQRLMGIDETVLYDGFLSGAGSTAQLSESIKNFTKVKIYGKTDDGGLGTGTNYPVYTEAYTDPDKLDVGIATTNNGWSKFLFMSLSGDKVTNVTGRVLTWGSTAWGSLTNWAIQKVIGIGRRS